jgi:4-diphosphocytidyl-2-C-methyl-D-erythritol kinase
MNRVTLFSPAKLNLFLKVQHKRPDGYHDIVTVFERIDLADKISFRSTSDQAVRITCDHRDVPVGPKNLIYKAAQLLKEECDLHYGVRIKLNKKIPVAAGLAGGSSNAATALLGLNRIWKLRLSKAKLLSLARKIGSDVPFFLYDTSWALGTERGDRIRKLDIKARFWHVLVIPHVKMLSGKVYQGLKLPVCSDKNIQSRLKAAAPNGGGTNILTKIHHNANILIRNLKKDNILGVGAILSNDLETEIFRLYPPLRKLKEQLKSLNTKGVVVSGSGPCVFGLTATEEEARSLKKTLSKRFSQVFVARTL